jgi:hypothetical protein
MCDNSSSPDNEILFNFNAMLMYGWVADKDLKVRRVNESLKDWLGEQGLNDINRQVQKGVEIRSFLTQLLIDKDQEVGDRVQEALHKLAEDIKQHGPIPRNEEEKRGDYYIRTIVRKVNNTAGGRCCLAGVRVVKIGGLRLRNGGDHDLVDLINICQVVKRDSGWQVTGFQGQLQEAWLRVETAIIQGTKAGSVGLMSRNLPHNIGSHALYWLEQDAGVDKRGKLERLFYRYLRERMELLAGFATALPMTWATTRLEALIKGFKENKLLLDRIGKSEGVKEVEVDLPKEDDRMIALTGGVLGAQALYLILENIIRDSAKFGRASGDGARRSTTLHLNVRVAEPADAALAENFIQITVSDDLNNYEMAAGGINKELDELRIADEGGRLVTGGWGIKERFIAALFLRGMRPENISLQDESKKGKSKKGTINLRLGRRKLDGLPILKLTRVGGHLGWVFYLFKPKGVLLVTDEKAHQRKETPELTVKDFDWLRKDLDRSNSIRHRFVVLCPRTQEDVDWLKGKAAWHAVTAG